jgi:hypothetical protein
LFCFSLRSGRLVLLSLPLRKPASISLINQHKTL